MKTANELADELGSFVDYFERCKDYETSDVLESSAAMLRTLAQEIESLNADFCKQLDEVSTRNYNLRKENEALKADAALLEKIEAITRCTHQAGISDHWEPKP